MLTEKAPLRHASPRLVNAQFALYAPGAETGHGFLLFRREQTLVVQAFYTGRLKMEGDPVPLAEPVGQSPRP
jgi:hypothetical protein